MKAFKVTLLIIDHDEVAESEGEKAIGEYIENARYPNRCLSPHVMQIESRDMGEWTDEHPLNNTKLAGAEFKRLFGEPA